MAPNIFVSYSHKNVEFATKLTKDLEREGYDIWLDRTDIQTGSRWDDEIVKGLNTSQVFMILLSDTSSVSQNVKDEIGYAVDHNMHIVPLLIEPCELPFRLRRLQYVDFTKQHYEDGIKAVLRILRAVLIDAAGLPKPEERKPLNTIALTTGPLAPVLVKKEVPMDSATSLAAAVVAVLSPYLAKAGEELAKELGKRVATKIDPLYQVLKRRFESKPGAQEALADLESNPGDADAQASLRVQLIKQMKADPELTDTLQKLLDEIERDEESVSFLTEVYGGEVGQIINAKHIGTINFNKEPRPK